MNGAAPNAVDAIVRLVRDEPVDGFERDAVSSAELTDHDRKSLHRGLEEVLALHPLPLGVVKIGRHG